jgi:mannose-6-phosphate isomerase
VPGNRLEPGHQFEWFSLVRSAPDIFTDTVLWSAVAEAQAFAQRHGVDVETDGVCAALDMEGAPSDGTQRIWAQTEYARALAVVGDTAALSRLRHQLGRFRDRFLHANGWHECLDAHGSRARTDMPSTTPYHLATCYEALP